MPKPSRRWLLFASVILIVIGAPLVLFVVSVAHAVVTPPVPGARFFSYDGLRLDTSCANSLSAKGRRVLMCDSSFRIESRFAIVNHDSRAVAWCIERIDESHYDAHPPKQFGPLSVGGFPTVAADWGECTQMLPIQAGMYARLIINY